MRPPSAVAAIPVMLKDGTLTGEEVIGWWKRMLDEGFVKEDKSFETHRHVLQNDSLVLHATLHALTKGEHSLEQEIALFLVFEERTARIKSACEFTDSAQLGKVVDAGLKF
ncbi:hypothetical protein JCM11641_006251 [Rhodosporidiobolus odoratus]